MSAPIKQSQIISQSPKNRRYIRKNKKAKIANRINYEYKNVLKREIKSKDIAPESERGNKPAIVKPHLDKTIVPSEVAFFITLVGKAPDGTPINPKKYQKVYEKECSLHIFRRTSKEMNAFLKHQYEQYPDKYPDGKPCWNEVVDKIYPVRKIERSKRTILMNYMLNSALGTKRAKSFELALWNIVHDYCG